MIAHNLTLAASIAFAPRGSASLESLCVILAALGTAELALRAGVAHATVARVLLTDDSMASHTPSGRIMRPVLHEAGVRVVEADPGLRQLMLAAVGPKVMGATLKLAALSLLEYDGVLVVDWDKFFVKPLRWDPLRAPWAVQFVSMVGSDGRLHGNPRTPLNAGAFAVAPSAARLAALTTALKQGFSRGLGWRGDYPDGLQAHLRLLECARGAAADQTAPWCFIGSSFDQGLLTHLVATEPSNRAAGWTATLRSAGSGAAASLSGSSCHMINSGQPKPWDVSNWAEVLRLAASTETSFRNSAGDFWAGWPRLLAPVVARSTDACSAPMAARADEALTAVRTRADHKALIAHQGCVSSAAPLLAQSSVSGAKVRS